MPCTWVSCIVHTLSKFAISHQHTKYDVWCCTRATEVTNRICLLMSESHFSGYLFTSFLVILIRTEALCCSNNAGWHFSHRFFVVIVFFSFPSIMLYISIHCFGLQKRCCLLSCIFVTGLACSFCINSCSTCNDIDGRKEIIYLQTVTFCKYVP